MLIKKEIQKGGFMIKANGKYDITFSKMAKVYFEKIMGDNLIISNSDLVTMIGPTRLKEKIFLIFRKLSSLLLTKESNENYDEKDLRKIKISNKRILKVEKYDHELYIKYKLSNVGSVRISIFKPENLSLNKLNELLNFMEENFPYKKEVNDG